MMKKIQMMIAGMVAAVMLLTVMTAITGDDIDAVDGDVVIVETGDKPDTLQDAIGDADGKTIKLLRSFGESVTVPEGISITIDLNGQTLWGLPNVPTITNQGVLVIKDGATGGIVKKIDGTDSVSAYVILNNGTLTIEGGTVQNTGPSTAAMLCNTGLSADKKATLNVTGGKIMNNQNNSILVNNEIFGIMNVSGGEFDVGSKTGTQIIQNWSELNISGGTISTTGSIKNWIREATDNPGTVASVTISGTQTLPMIVTAPLDVDGADLNSIKIRISGNVSLPNITCNIKTDITIDSAASLTGTVKLAYNKYSTLTNNGTITIAEVKNITVNAGNTAVNAGTITSNGTININGLLTNTEDGTITNNGKIQLSLVGTLANNGDINNNALIESSSVTVNIINRGVISNSDTINNKGAIVNYGNVINEGTVTSSEAGSSITNNHVWTGNPVADNYVENGKKIEVASQGSKDVTNGIEITASGSNAVSFTPTVVGSSGTSIDVKLAGNMAVSFPADAVTASTPVSIVMMESDTVSEVGGKVFSVDTVGVSPGTILTITLPATSANSKVYYVVGGVVQDEMVITERTSTTVTFIVAHNSEFAVVTMASSSGPVSYTVTINSGTGAIVSNATGSTTQAGTFVFSVTPSEGYEIQSVQPSNGAISKNGLQYTLSNVTSDTTIQVVTTEVVKDTAEESSTSSYLLIGAAVAAVVLLSLVAMMFGKKS